MNVKQIIKLLLHRWWLFVLFAAIGGGASFYVSYYVLEPVYVANTSIFVNDKNLDNSEYGIAYDQILVNTQLIADYTELMKSRSIAKAVIDDLGLKDVSVDMIRGMISVSSRNGTRIIEISVKSNDPETAVKISDSVAKVFSRKAVELMNVLNVNIVDPAELPESPLEPGRLRNIALAVCAALVLAMGVILAAEYLDNTIKSSEDVEERLGLTVLGIIPEFRMK